MKIGVDSHSLEGIRTGARGRYLLNLVKEWAKIDTGDNQFMLYFQERVPNFGFLSHKKFTKKILRAPFGIKSFSLYYNILLPMAAKKDMVDVCFFPFYMLPFSWREKSAVVTIHDTYFEANPKEFHFFRHWIPLRFLTKNAADNAKYIITPSEFSKSEVVKYYKINPDKIKVIYLAPDEIFKKEKNLEEIGKIKAKYDLKNNYILSVGTIFSRRCLDKIIKAFSNIASKFPAWQFFIAGRNLTKPYIDLDGLIKEKNRDLGRKAIIRVNHVDDEDLTCLYSGAGFTIYLSTYEGFGLPPLESMAAGVPAMTTNLTALKESVNGAGVIIENPGDIKEISETIKGLITDPEFRGEMTEIGRRWAEQFSWKKTAYDTLEVLRSICKPR